MMNLCQIEEVVNDSEHIVPHIRRDRTNSDNWADNVLYVSNEIKQELSKPTN